MNLPAELLSEMASGIDQFVEEEEGKGIAEYGAILAIISLVAGLVYGFFFWHADSTQPCLKTPPKQQRAAEGCVACGMG